MKRGFQFDSIKLFQFILEEFIQNLHGSQNTMRMSSLECGSFASNVSKDGRQAAMEPWECKSMLVLSTILG